jgi:hypothetical protein
MPYHVHSAGVFLRELEAASEWLYSHNEKQSVEFADKKKLQLQNEVTTLKSRLSENPYNWGTELISKFSVYRKLSLYEGRYQAEWIINDSKQKVSLLRFKDLKYPVEMRQKEFIFDEN